MLGPQALKFSVLGGTNRGPPYEERYPCFQILTKPTSGLTTRWESVQVGQTSGAHVEEEDPLWMNLNEPPKQ